MNSRSVVCIVAALSMGLGGVAVAQQDKDMRADEANRRDHVGRGHPGSHPDRQAPPQRRWDRGPGAGPDHNYYPGGRLPPQYRGREYVVDDWVLTT